MTLCRCSRGLFTGNWLPYRFKQQYVAAQVHALALWCNDVIIAAAAMPHPAPLQNLGPLAEHESMLPVIAIKDVIRWSNQHNSISTNKYHLQAENMYP